MPKRRCCRAMPTTTSVLPANLATVHYFAWPSAFVALTLILMIVIIISRIRSLCTSRTTAHHVTKNTLDPLDGLDSPPQLSSFFISGGRLASRILFIQAIQYWASIRCRIWGCKRYLQTLSKVFRAFLQRGYRHG